MTPLLLFLSSVSPLPSSALSFSVASAGVNDRLASAIASFPLSSFVSMFLSVCVCVCVSPPLRLLFICTVAVILLLSCVALFSRPIPFCSFSAPLAGSCGQFQWRVPPRQCARSPTDGRHFPAHSKRRFDGPIKWKNPSKKGEKKKKKKKKKKKGSRTSAIFNDPPRRIISIRRSDPSAISRTPHQPPSSAPLALQRSQLMARKRETTTTTTTTTTATTTTTTTTTTIGAVKASMWEIMAERLRTAHQRSSIYKNNK